MNLEQYRGSIFLLLGKTRALPEEECMTLLKRFDITIVQEAKEGISLIVEGRMMSPWHEQERDRLYEKKAAPFVTIDALEKALCASIDEKRLLMSLKLSNNQQRLIGFLKNPYIADTLFLKLLSLYRWQNEGFFGSDENRDVSAALIERFYEDIERNHNVQYANTGLVHLLKQTRNSDVIDAVFGLEPIQNALKKGGDKSMMHLIDVIASHEASSQQVQHALMASNDAKMLMHLAARAGISKVLQQQLSARQDASLLLVLCRNSDLDPDLALHLAEHAAYAKEIALHVRLNQELFHTLCQEYGCECAANITLHVRMQQQLFARDEIAINRALAANSALDSALQESLGHSDDLQLRHHLASNPSVHRALLKRFVNEPCLHSALASNPSCDGEILTQLSQSGDFAVQKALAHNPSTPIEILFQLHLDARLKRTVHENPAFGKHIQTQNIGWL